MTKYGYDAYATPSGIKRVWYVCTNVYLLISTGFYLCLNCLDTAKELQLRIDLSTLKKIACYLTVKKG
jgi:hypothetical protein